MSIDALTQAKSTLEGVRGALGIYSKTEVDMTLGMLDRAIANYTSLDAICQDLQEKTYTQAMRIAELEAKLLDKQQFTNVVNPSIHAGSGEKTGEKHDFHHSGIEQKPLASDGSDGSTYKKAIDDVQKAFKHRSLAEAEKQEPLFWYRPRSDGFYEGPIHNAQIEKVREESGAWKPLYTHPQPKRQWVGLTDEVKQEWIDAMPYDIEPRHCMNLINVMEAKLKELNT